MKMVRGVRSAACLLLALAGIEATLADAGEEALSPGNMRTMTAERSAHQKAYDAMPDTMGSGPYPAHMTTDESLPRHTIYMPENLQAMDNAKMGVLLWGNGGCVDDGASARLHLAEIASHGYLVIAPGKILSGPSAPEGMGEPVHMATNDQDMLEGLDWAIEKNQHQESPLFNRIDTEAVAVSGHSCGGILALKIGSEDKRIKTVIVHNSGIFPNRPERPTLITDKAWLKNLHTPVLYVIGNSTDVGSPVALDDFERIDHVPIFMASLDVGHQGTFSEPNGGVAAQMAVNWLQWQLRKSTDAGKYFLEPDCLLCANEKLAVRKKGFE